MDGTAGDIEAHVLSGTCVGLALDVRAAAHLADFEIVILFLITIRLQAHQALSGTVIF